METQERTHDTELQELLTALLTRVKKFGSRSEEVKSFILEHRDVPEFLELAATCIFIVEGHKVAEKSATKSVMSVIQWAVMLICVMGLCVFFNPMVGIALGLGWVAGFFNGLAW
jgi:hypothetical protein